MADSVEEIEKKKRQVEIQPTLRLFANLDHSGASKNRDLYIAEPQPPQNLISVLTQHRRATSDFARRLR